MTSNMFQLYLNLPAISELYDWRGLPFDLYHAFIYGRRSQRFHEYHLQAFAPTRQGPVTWKHRHSGRSCFHLFNPLYWKNLDAL